MRAVTSSGAPSTTGCEPVRRFLPVALTKPVLAAALGIDGGSIFQIVATDDLRLSSQAIGIAFGLGLLSLPLQLWAGRMPIRLAARNLQAFLLIAALQTAVLAWLVGTEARGSVAQNALAVTITAEVAISVLFVTAWQPLLSLRAAAEDRQRLNAGWSAVGKAVLAGSLLIFTSVDREGRVLFLIVLALVALGVAISLRRMTVDQAGRADGPKVKRQPGAVFATPGLVWILISFTTINLGALPLWLVYLANVLWPAAPLGVVGAVQTLATVAALLAWRTTSADLGRRAIGGAVPLVAGSIGLVAVGTSAATHWKQAVVLGTTIAMSFGMMYASLAVLEMAHRLTSQQGNVVKIFTLIDVVDSSSLQLGLLLGGLLAASPLRPLGLTPYVGFIVVTNVLALAATARTALATRAVRARAPSEADCHSLAGDSQNDPSGP